MEIISQKYNKILEEIIIKNFNNNIKDKIHRFRDDNQVFNYIEIISSIDKALCDVARETLINIFETIDRGFRNSPERMHSYHIKSKVTRTILTVFGEITYRKTNYVNKHTNKHYCYIDEYLGLKKYDYFDPYIKALILEYAANNSSGKIIQFINDLIGNRLKIETKINYISRQSIRNIIIEANIAKEEYKELNTPETLYIMADEKWVHTQNNNNESVMVKEIVVFDGKEKIYNQNKLKNKKIFSSFNNNNFINECLDYIYYSYKVEQIKNIYVMGDGAKWIKSLQYEFKLDSNINVCFALDKFHFKQAIHHIFQDNELEKIISEYVTHNKRKDFINACNTMIEVKPHRKDVIEEKEKYILNNWKSINNLYKNKLSCPMESQISHILADLFTSRPKGYSIKTLKKILPLRISYKNQENIKLLFLFNYNKKEIVKINQQFLNYSLFNKPTNEFNMSLIDYKYLQNYHHDNTVDLKELYHNF